ncbi:hypothetical protein GCM10008015_25420 [Flavobacterium palustre]|uniref:DUF1761 domain-containing protein n=1 Tax=Flavobacterium palustre TaxID=1476463 RepID=A0ABQ1HPQ6_9FLAO|nr:DUF1761 domain-containing protein [Flavobacterium palustre]GGA83498.1 hypothetical protein GCM10008015_25420 [Flavobacterium palustre]
MEINFLALFVAALSTLIIGFIWYNPKVFGTIWMKESGLTEEKMKGANMPAIFIMAVFFAFLIAMILQFLTIHQWGAFGMIGGGGAAEVKPSYAAFMNDYGTAFRSFKHGALHGFLAGLFLAFPMTATNALFERKSWKYTCINSGYWMLCFMIMGGIICAWQ